MARKRKGKFVRAFFGLIVIFAICGYAWMLRERRQTEEDLAAIQNLGVPISIEAYKASLSEPRREGTKLYDSAVDAWEKIPESDRKYVDEVLNRSRNNLSKAFSDNDKKRLSDLMSQTTALFRKAASTDWAGVSDNAHKFQESKTNLDRFDALQNGIKLLIRAADQKEPFNQAFNEISYAGKLAGESMRSPVGTRELSQSLSLDIEQLKGWQRTLARGVDDPKTIEVAARVLKSMPEIPSLPKIFQSTFLEGLWKSDNYVVPADGKAPKEQAFGDRLREMILESTPAQVERKRFYVQEWRGLFETLPGDPEDWRGYDRAAVKAAKDSRTPIELRDGDPVWLLPTIIRRREESVAWRRVAKTAMAILQQRLETGKLPATVPKLGSESSDPFTGKPLIYKRLPQGFKVYSIGRDEIDNEGTPRMPDSDSTKYDVVMQFR